MRVLRRLRLSYANVIATLALFIALGGTSYAAFALPRSSVGARELKRGSVTASEVRNGSLRVRDLEASSRPAVVRYARVRRGSAGETSLESARGFTLGAIYNSLVYLNPTDFAIHPRAARRGCAVSAVPVTRIPADIGPSGPARPGGIFLEVNEDLVGTIAVYAFDRRGNPAQSSFDLMLVCPRP